MAVNANAETIRQMASDIKNTISDIQTISNGIRSAVGSLGDWDDDRAAEFTGVMLEIANLTSEPIQDLEDAIPRLNRMAQALDEYASQSM